MSNRLLVVLAIAGSLVACASAPTPEMLKLAEARKGQVKVLVAELEPKDFSRVCGYAKPHESLNCSRFNLNIISNQMAEEYCINYQKMGPLKFEDSLGGMYPRSSKATFTITCKGSK